MSFSIYKKKFNAKHSNLLVNFSKKVGKILFSAENHALISNPSYIAKEVKKFVIRTKIIIFFILNQQINFSTFVLSSDGIQLAKLNIPNYKKNNFWKLQLL